MADLALALNTDDLEDGEIESDGEETVNTPQAHNRIESNSTGTDILSREKSKPQNFYYSKSGKKKKIKSNKSEYKKDKSKKSRKYANSNEDDFAGNIERAIRKAMNKNDESQMQSDDALEERRKHKKRKKHDGNDGSAKKRKKQEIADEMDESEMMCVRGASPVKRPASNEDEYSDEDRDSYASDSSHSGTRDQSHRKNRVRPIQRDRNINKNERRRGAHPMQDPDGVCQYYMQGKCHKGDDCIYSHDAKPPRKMELCKFYLMECCAKRDKCLYMHSDFPCKYYHTGLPCIYKDDCKFAHGRPLNDSLKSILLKHIESAPKEILGDFPRLNREGALKMIQTTQLKLMQQFSDNSDNQVKSIPSLFDLHIPNPLNNLDPVQSNQFINEKLNKISPKVRQSRWQIDDSSQSNTLNLSPNGNSGTTNVLNIKNLTGVLTPRQISDLSKMGIENLDQLGQLTVLQLNSIGISLKQITEIQLNTMSIQKLGLINNVDQQSQFLGIPAVPKDLDLRVSPMVPIINTMPVPAEMSGQDVDMRFQQNPVLGIEENSTNKIVNNDTQSKDMIDIDQYTKDALKFASKDKENIDISNETYDNEKSILTNETKDVDHRVLPFPEENSRVDRPFVVHENTTRVESDTDIRFLQPEPIFKNPAKRNRRSTTDDDEDNNLLIDEKWYSSDEEKASKKKTSPSHSPNCMMSPTNPLPSVIETATVLSKIGDLSKIDISEEVTKLLNTMKNNLQDSKTCSNDLSSNNLPRDPRSKRSPVKVVEVNKTAPKKPPRVSIYECLDGEPTDGRRRSDVDLRQSDYKIPTFGDTDLRQSTSGDIDFRLGIPFKPLSNYTPATEINGSINNHPPIPYKLSLIEIPRPDYTDIKNSKAKSQALKDPRLRKVFRLSLDESNSDSEKSTSLAPPTPRVDPRRKPKDTIENSTLESKSNVLEIQTILQNSNWFKELSSTQKIFVNEHLAPVSQILKQYQQEKQLGKKFDLSQIHSNSILCNIFVNLGVTLGENGEYSYLPKPKEGLLKTPANFSQNPNQFGMNPNMPGPPGSLEGNINMPPPMGIGGGGGMNNMNLGAIHGFNQNISDPRGAPAPGLLGIAPNMPHSFNNNNYGGPPAYGNMGFNGPPHNDFNFDDGDSNFQRYPNRGGGRGRGNDRWNRGGSGRSHRDRQNFNERGKWKNDRH